VVDGCEVRDSLRIDGAFSKRNSDIVALEGPLSISVSYGGDIIPLGISMRTPGKYSELVYGFLLSEGIISSSSDVLHFEINDNMALVEIKTNSGFNPENYVRRTTMSSSCGICGRNTISDMLHMHAPVLSEDLLLDYIGFSSSIEKMTASQVLFQQSGGTHACASFTQEGELVNVFEDVGRHNAMDKLVGAHMLQDSITPSKCILLVSGRASFDLVQKSIRSGFSIMLAIGAPSTLAVDLANEHGLTLACFCKESTMTVFSGARRVK